MKSLEIIGFKRANLGKTDAKATRALGQVPCVLYGGGEQVHFAVPAILFKNLVYTAKTHLVDLNVEGTIYKAILQDINFHPVNEAILHADFLQISEDKPVRMSVPVQVKGTSKGVMEGGRLVLKLRKITVKALPANLPDFISVDISGLEVGKTIKVGNLEVSNFEILNPASVPIVSVEITRALRQAASADKGK